MIKKAVENHGLKIKNNHGYIFQPDHTKKIHDSYKFYYGPKERRVATISENHCPKVHKSVLKKVQRKRDYKPLALVDYKKRATLEPYIIVQ